MNQKIPHVLVFITLMQKYSKGQDYAGTGYYPKPTTIPVTEISQDTAGTENMISYGPPPTPNPPSQNSSCGNRNINGVGNSITTGTNGESAFGEFPWMAAIIQQNPEDWDPEPTPGIFICGGALITPNIVITAAHCVAGIIDQLIVRLGAGDPNIWDPSYPQQDIPVRRLVIHNNYTGIVDRHNDIALLFLAQDATIAPNVDTVCLPPQDSNFYGQTCVAAGWNNETLVLTDGNVTVQTQDVCQWSLLAKIPNFTQDSSLTCTTREPPPYSCRGDDGTPLVCQLPNSDSYAVAGVLAFGNDCGLLGEPVSYANVAQFADWIQAQINQPEEDSNSWQA